ncbi:MAG: hypothetical protein R3F17_15560 [Planctomycetota bacterium]
MRLRSLHMQGGAWKASKSPKVLETGEIVIFAHAEPEISLRVIDAARRLPLAGVRLVATSEFGPGPFPSSAPQSAWIGDVWASPIVFPWPDSFIRSEDPFLTHLEDLALWVGVPGYAWCKVVPVPRRTVIVALEPGATAEVHWPVPAPNYSHVAVWPPRLSSLDAERFTVPMGETSVLLDGLPAGEWHLALQQGDAQGVLRPVPLAQGKVLLHAGDAQRIVLETVSAGDPVRWSGTLSLPTPPAQTPSVLLYTLDSPRVRVQEFEVSPSELGTEFLLRGRQVEPGTYWVVVLPSGYSDTIEVGEEDLVVRVPMPVALRFGASLQNRLDLSEWMEWTPESRAFLGDEICGPKREQIRVRLYQTPAPILMPGTYLAVPIEGNGEGKRRNVPFVVKEDGTVLAF